MNLAVNIMAIMVIFIFISDVYFIKKYGKQATYSAHIIRFIKANKKGFYIGLLVGIVFGHLGWSMSTEDVYNVDCKPLKTQSKE